MLISIGNLNYDNADVVLYIGKSAMRSYWRIWGQHLTSEVPVYLATSKHRDEKAGKSVMDVKVLSIPETIAEIAETLACGWMTAKEPSHRYLIDVRDHNRGTL